MLNDAGDATCDLRTFCPYRADALGELRLTFEGAPQAIVVLGEDRNILFVNAAASKIFACAPCELLGQPLSSLLSEQPDDDDWIRFWQRPDRRTIGKGWTLTGRRRDGIRVPIEIGLDVVENGPTCHVIVSVLDVTERLKVEAQPAATLAGHVTFHRLVADLAAQLARADDDALDEAISECLARIGKALTLDWAVLWSTNPAGAVVFPTHCWLSSSSAVRPAAVLAASLPPLIANQKPGEVWHFASADDMIDPATRDICSRHGIQSGAVIPLASGEQGEPQRTLSLAAATRQDWAPAIVDSLRLAAGAIGQACARRAGHIALQEARGEIRRLQERISAEDMVPHRKVSVMKTSYSTISESPAIREMLANIEQVAPTPATVLLLGETGTGKEVMAQAIHNLSPRHQRPMVRVSCAAIPTALIESELFGRERGAYTGALSRQIGRFEAANQSTLFLDEIGELPLEVQVKLLRVLQERVIERLGSTQPIKVDVRIIAATNRNLEDAVREKTFREDLYYRLNVFPVTVPALRERVEDIPALVWSFIDEFSRAFGKTIESISKDSMRELEGYPWPGNVRELRNVIERAVIVANGRHLVVSAPRVGDRPMPRSALTLSALEDEHIRGVLESCGWRVRGAGGAADRLGLKPTTLESRMARLGITRKKAQTDARL